MISIITPAYNAQDYLTECIDSIRGQSYADWQLVIVDDGSTDSTAVIADRAAAADCRITVLHTSNRGVSAARNAALDVAEGEYLVFVDADDALASPDALQCLVDAEKAAGGDAIVIARHTYTPDASGLCHADVRIKDAGAVVEDILYQKGIEPAPWAKLFPAASFAGVRYPEGLRYEDLYLTPCIIARYGLPVAFIDSELYYYRMHPGSFLHKWSDARLDALTVTEALEKQFPGNAARSRRLSANFNVYALARDNGKKAVADGCWAYIRANRVAALADPRVRFRNKAAALLTYFGRRAFDRLCRILYR